MVKCPAQIEISKDQIEKGQEVKSWEDKDIQIPHEALFVLPKESECVTEIVLKSDVPETMRGAFSFTEWQDDISIQLIKLEEGESYTEDTSTLFAKGSRFYSRDTKEGDLAGRVPIAKNEKYKLVMINYSETETRSAKLQYGSAVQSAAVGLVTLISTLAFFMF